MAPRHGRVLWKCGQGLGARDGRDPGPGAGLRSFGLPGPAVPASLPDAANSQFPPFPGNPNSRFPFLCYSKFPPFPKNPNPRLPFLCYSKIPLIFLLFQIFFFSRESKPKLPFLCYSRFPLVFMLFQISFCSPGIQTPGSHFSIIPIFPIPVLFPFPHFCSIPIFLDFFFVLFPCSSPSQPPRFQSLTYPGIPSCQVFPIPGYPNFSLLFLGHSQPPPLPRHPKFPSPASLLQKRPKKVNSFLFPPKFPESRAPKIPPSLPGAGFPKIPKIFYSFIPQSSGQVSVFTPSLELLPKIHQEPPKFGKTPRNFQEILGGMFGVGEGRERGGFQKFPEGWGLLEEGDTKIVKIPLG